MTKPQISIFFIILVLLAPSFGFAHGLYTGSLPAATIYADDFESYTTTTCTATVSSQILSACLGGWNFIDNGAGGIRGINNTNFYSCCHSLYLQDSTAASGKFDVDRRFGLPNNTTRIITASFWFAFTKPLTTANNQNAGNVHFAIEAWNKVNHFECLTFMYGDTIGVHPDFITAPSVDNNNPNSHFETWDDTLNGGDIAGYWHHVTMSCDILNMKWGTIVIDGFDYSAQVTGQTMRTLADTGLQNFNPPQGFRFEFATQNGGTHTVPADTFNAWFDDLTITDTTTSTPVIQFGITLLSAWFPILVASIALLYSTSGIGLIRRVWFNKTDGILTSYRTIAATGIIATIGFIVLLAVGALLTQQVCSSLPQGTATCSY